tara:strand:+ start:403 stop:867 length:465 start_codon:yes stop_codon:yes gene_type:complete
MAAPLDVDREKVKMLCMSLGVREAARQMSLPESTVKSWCTRGKWLASTRPTPAMIAPPPTVLRASSASNPIISPADALANALADDSKATRISLSRSARNMARQAETAPLEQAGDVVQAAKVASMVHGWEEQGAEAHPINLVSAMQVNIQVNTGN